MDSRWLGRVAGLGTHEGGDAEPNCFAGNRAATCPDLDLPGLRGCRESKRFILRKLWK